MHQTIQLAADHLNAGRVQQAEMLIRQVLQNTPDNHEALNLLGVIALNSGHPDQAAEIFSRASQLNPNEAEYHCNLGVALLNTNRADEGQGALQTALKLKPGHAMANMNLGLLLLQNGQLESALPRLEKAVKKMPKNPAALNALGVVHSKIGKPIKAVQLFRAALKIQPNLSNAQLNLAGGLTEMGKLDEAIALYEKFIAQTPDHPGGYFNLGVALRKANRDLEAISAYEQALKLAPDYVDAHVNLSVLHMGRDHQSAALAHIRAARELRPDDIHIMNNEALTLFYAGLGDQAIAACDHILELSPDNSETLGIKIAALQNDGQFAQARELAGDTTAPPILLALSLDKDYVLSDAQIESLQSAAQDNTNKPEDTVRAGFALARVYHKQGNFTAAFDTYKRANALRDGTFNWSEEDEQNLFSSLEETFSEAYFNAPVSGQQSDRPIFIVGMPRSGTTLVEQIIASHPDAAGGGELSDIKTFSDELTLTLKSSTPYPGCARELDSATADALATQYLNHLGEISADAARVTDKMPDNYLHLGLIARLFPKAQIIYCRRDPMANCFSIFKQNFHGYHPYAYDLTKLGRRYRNHTRLMDHWHKVLPVPILEVAYEDLVQDQEGQSRRIMEFCGLKWDARVLDFHKTKRTVQTASLWQVRQPIYTDALTEWKAYESYLAPLSEALGQE